MGFGILGTAAVQTELMAPKIWATLKVCERSCLVTARNCGGGLGAWGSRAPSERGCCTQAPRRAACSWTRAEPTPQGVNAGGSLSLPGSRVFAWRHGSAPGAAWANRARAAGARHPAPLAPGTAWQRRWAGDGCWEQLQRVTQLLFEVPCPRRTVLIAGLRSGSRFPRVPACRAARGSSQQPCQSGARSPEGRGANAGWALPSPLRGRGSGDGAERPGPAASASAASIEAWLIRLKCRGCTGRGGALAPGANDGLERSPKVSISQWTL